LVVGVELGDLAVEFGGGEGLEILSAVDGLEGLLGAEGNFSAGEAFYSF